MKTAMAGDGILIENRVGLLKEHLSEEPRKRMRGWRRKENRIERRTAARAVLSINAFDRVATASGDAPTQHKVLRGRVRAPLLVALNSRQ